MEKGMAVSAFVISLLVLLVFGLDLVAQIPFDLPDSTLSIGFVVSSAILAVLSFITWRQLK